MSFASPTTPGLTVEFKNYIIELVCLNMERKLGARFWKEPKWASKYARECRGFAKFAKMHDRLDEPLYQQAIIKAVRRLGCKSLLIEHNLTRLDRAVRKEYEQVLAAGERPAEQPQAPKIDDPAEYARRNARIVNTEEPNRFEKLRGIEKRGHEGERTKGSFI